MKEPRIEPERIAELLDGRLEEPERGRLLVQLATSGEFCDFAETAAVLREAEAVEGRKPRRLPPSTARARGWRTRPGRWLAIGAVLALAVLAPILWLARDRAMDHPGAPAALLSAMDAGLPPGWTARPAWEAALGTGDPLDAGARAVRAGALHTALLVALQGGGAEDAARIRDQLVALLSLPGTAPLASHYRELRMDAPTVAVDLESAGEALATSLGKEDVLWGAWLEAARIAAARRDAAFFRSGRTSGILDRAAESERISDAGHATLSNVRTSLNAEVIVWPGVQRDLDTLLRDATS